MDASEKLELWINHNKHSIGKVIDISPADALFRMDLTNNNKELTADIITDTTAFSNWIDQKLFENNCRYGIGGYMENRTIYAGIPLFETADEPRRLHLGIDIWGAAGTPIYSPLNGTIHSFKDNAHHGDYGPTIIVEHDLDELKLYSLYGHLSRTDLQILSVGQAIVRDQQIGTFGAANENGDWPPHLHFQLMLDLEGQWGDYPGACRYSEKEKYLKNIPDPGLLLPFLKS
jgi:hypothetical protein